jgi:hypothetical protein
LDFWFENKPSGNPGPWYRFVATDERPVSSNWFWFRGNARPTASATKYWAALFIQTTSVRLQISGVNVGLF